MKNMVKRHGALVAYVFLVAVSSLTIYGLYHGYEVDQRARAERRSNIEEILSRQCEQVNRVRSDLRLFIVNSIRASDFHLNDLEYYQQHPVELARAHAANAAAIRNTNLRFAPEKCGVKL